ncbi:hypothetical protein LTS00_007212 [Friedmanniomyces endolithicus]|uniref:Major facilitator superfamily (MFS) profile domain-containing protein n=1 Tax=Friedmanniomyces endolithicus TaxID=329885 RepID=A0AAN6FYW8_9PEZI|nr:hypothetical protein LTS00_007212 [Friedmanniomyces endolithicus]KAK0325457.1 hypothetical protein LTR82_003740 [Friedmanniomyces endolithicus]
MSTSTTTITAVTATTEHELQDYSHSSATEPDDRHLQTEQLDAVNTGGVQDSDNVASAIPDSGYGWAIVLSCSILTFHFNGFTGSWGVLQSHLLQTSLPDVTTSTITFVGSLATAATVAFGLASVRLTRLVGARLGAVAGVTLLGLAQVLSGFTTSQVGGLFGLSGVMVGLGMSLLYTINNTLPTQYFSSKLGTANGLIKFGGGIGATVLAIVVELLIERVGIPWTFRIIGFITLSTGIPAALLLKERTRGRNAPFLELAMFRNPAYTAVFIAAALGAFTLFAPPYFLPLVARSVGLSSTTGAGLVAGFNACTAIGRLVSGPTCDRIGPTNTFLITMLLSAVSMLAIWPFSSNLPLLAVFVVLNGIANGSFFVTMPTVAAAMFGPERAPVAMSQAVTGWTVGYLVGPPIAGYLIQATGAESKSSLDPYRPAIFYAGGLALVSAVFVLIGRVAMERKVLKRV